MLKTGLHHLIGALGFGVLLSLSFAVAQDSSSVRIRGTIERIEGSNLVVKARDGAERTVVLADNTRIVAIVKASLADVKPGTFVGIAGMPQADGSERALEVHLFPEAMRGTGEGHRAWDLMPQSTMTNGNVEQTVLGVDGQRLTVSYKGGTQKIMVPADAPVVAYMLAEKSDLKPGLKIFIAAARQQPDGTLKAPRVNFGKDGLTPPM